MDEFGRLEFSEADRDRFKALWNSADRDILVSIKDQMTDLLLGILRSCDKEQVDIVRGQLDALDRFFSILEDSAKEGKADASERDRYISQTI